MSPQHLTDGFSISIDALDACHKVAAVALKEDSILRPMVVFIVVSPCFLELTVGLGFRVEHEAVSSEYWRSNDKARHIPSTHYVAVPTENFCQTADNDIPIWQDIHVEEISNGFINYHAEVILVCQVANALEVWGSKKWICRELGEERRKTLAAFEPLLQVIQLF